MNHKKLFPMFFLLAGGIVLILSACTSQSGLTGNPVRGGQLYDKWWVVIGVDAPTGDQSLWKTQSTNTRNGADTWRCKECHGWDYKGKDGAYGSGSHFTGFVGVINASGKKPTELLAILKGSTSPDHNFSKVMDEQALTDLALFLNQGLTDDAVIVNNDKSPVNGNTGAGAVVFSLCATCHGPQGTAINFGNESGPEYLGTIAEENPWEFLHKARFGQPGVMIMPTGFTMNRADQEYADLLAYVQTLPVESPVTEGGRLYDKWWAAIGVDAPSGNQPLWATQSTNTRSGADTWRCKECHGWDYKGMDGVYGSGSHRTGFPGVMAAATMNTAEVTAWLTGGKNADHDFSPYLNEAQINMLAAFIQRGVADRSSYIAADGTVNGDAARGETNYTAVCIRCHGVDGKTINFGDADKPEYVGTVAADNPWEAFHKVSFGQPGQNMPAGLNFGWSLQDIADLAAYLQTLPTK